MCVYNDGSRMHQEAQYYSFFPSRRLPITLCLYLGTIAMCGWWHTSTEPCVLSFSRRLDLISHVSTSQLWHAVCECRPPWGICQQFWLFNVSQFFAPIWEAMREKAGGESNNTVTMPLEKRSFLYIFKVHVRGAPVYKFYVRSLPESGKAIFCMQLTYP